MYNTRSYQQPVGYSNGGNPPPPAATSNGGLQQPSSRQVPGADKLKFQMNLCLVCNNVFVEKAATPDAGLIVFLNLCHLLQVPAYDEFVHESNPICTKCSTTVNEYLHLQQTIKDLMKQLGEIRKLLTTQLLDTYKVTPTTLRNYEVKKKIFEKIKGIVTSKRKVPSADRTKQPEFEETYREIVNSLESSQKPDASSTQSTGGNDSQLPATQTNDQQSQEYSLLDISNSVSSAPASNHGGPISSEGNADENHQNEDDNMSMGCPSPTSPPPLDDPQFDGGEVDVYVKNLMTEDDVQPPIQASILPVPEASSTESSTSNKGPPTVPNVPQWIDRRKIKPIIATQRRTHPCKFCGKLFPALFSLQLHERCHTGEKPFKCSICERGFAAKAAMQKHELTHDKSRFEGEPQFECDLCGKKYHLEQSLYSHKRDHMGIKRLTRFKKKYPKKKKVRDPNVPRKKPGPPKMIGPKNKRKPRPPRRKVRYDADGNPLPYVPRRRAEGSSNPPSNKPRKRPFFARTKRNEASKETVCSVCGKDCQLNYKLRAHMRVHTGEKPFKCPFPDCTKACAEKGNLDKHMKTHDATRFDGEPKHICETCGKAFYVLVTLYHHRRKNHLGFSHQYVWKGRKRTDSMKQPCECQLCGEKFATKYMLHNHRIRHHGLPKFNCEICDKPFYVKHDTVEHVKTHDPKWRYNTYFKIQCKGCPPERLGFRSKIAIREHWKAEHSDEPMPDEYKKPPKPNLPGHYVCTLCPEDNRLKFNTASSLLHHKKKVHRIPNVRKSNKKGSKRATTDKSGRRRGSEDDSSTDDDALDLDNDTTNSATDIKPVRRSVRPTRGDTSKILSLLKDSDEDSEDEDKLVPKQTSSRKIASIANAIIKSKPSKSTRAGPKSMTHRPVKPTASKATVPKRSSNLSESRVKQLLGGREMRLLLVRCDEQKEPEKTPVIIATSSVRGKRGQITTCPNSCPQEASVPTAKTLIEPLPSTTVGKRRGRKSENPPIASTDTESVPELATPLESAQVMDYDLQGQEISVSVEAADPDEIKLEPPSPPAPRRPDFSSPMIIHNPLLKNKAAEPIVISGAKTSAGVASQNSSLVKQETNVDNEEPSESVLGI